MNRRPERLSDLLPGVASDLARRRGAQPPTLTNRSHMTDIVWQDPPTPAGHYRWPDIAAELRGDPKRWALLKTFNNAQSAASWAWRARRGGQATFSPAEHWEFRTTGCNLYGRYVGESAGGAA